MNILGSQGYLLSFHTRLTVESIKQICAKMSAPQWALHRIVINPKLTAASRRGLYNSRMCVEVRGVKLMGKDNERYVKLLEGGNVDLIF